VPQAEALDELLKKKRQLDAVIRLRQQRAAAGSDPGRGCVHARRQADDTPEVLTNRLASYRSRPSR
jgi:adenylate kinase family enzyme